MQAQSQLPIELIFPPKFFISRPYTQPQLLTKLKFLYHQFFISQPLPQLFIELIFPPHQFLIYWSQSSLFFRFELFRAALSWLTIRSVKVFLFFRLLILQFQHQLLIEYIPRQKVYFIPMYRLTISIYFYLLLPC